MRAEHPGGPAVDSWRPRVGQGGKVVFVFFPIGAVAQHGIQQPFWGYFVSHFGAL